MPNPIAIIKEDHEIVKNLFTLYEGYTDNEADQKKSTANEILKALTVHMKMEEKYFYPRLKEAMGDDHPMLVDEANEEHHAARMLMLELKVMPVTSDTYDAKMKVLKEEIEHHVKEEEEEMLPKAEELLKGKLDEIGKEMEEYKESANTTILDKLLGEE